MQRHKNGDNLVNRQKMFLNCSFFAIVFMLWASSVLITVYNLSYLPKCPLERYNQCYHPLFREEDDFFLSIHVQDSIGFQSESVWNTTRNYANLTVPETTIKIPVPSDVRRNAYDGSMKAFKILFRMSKIIGLGNSDDNDKAEEADPLLSPHYTTSMSIPITAYRKRRLFSATKNLLGNSSDISTSTAYTKNRQQQFPFAHHWKFGYHPLVLRFTTLGDVLHSSHINALRYELSTKVVDSPSGRRRAYLPIQWVNSTSP